MRPDRAEAGSGIRVVALHTYPVKGCHRLDHDAARVEPWGLAGDRRWMVVDPDGVGLTQRRCPVLVTLQAAGHPGGLRLSAAGHTALDVPEPTGGRPVGVRVFRNRSPVSALAAGPVADDWLSVLLDRPVRLVWLGDPTRSPIPEAAYARAPGGVSFADGFPLLLANRASLDAVNGWLGEAGDPEAPVPMSRFRPNVVVGGAAPWTEDGWVGRRLRIGDAVFRAAGLCGRCLVTTIDQETGERGDQPLRVLGAHRRRDGKLRFGLNLLPDAGPDTPGPAPTIAVGDPVEPPPEY